MGRLPALFSSLRAYSQGSVKKAIAVSLFTVNRLLKLWTIGRVFEPIKALSDNASAFDTIVSLDVGTQLIQVDLWGIVIRVAGDVGRQEIFVELYIQQELVILLLRLGISENPIHTEGSRMSGWTKKKHSGYRVVFHQNRSKDTPASIGGGGIAASLLSILLSNSSFFPAE